MTNYWYEVVSLSVYQLHQQEKIFVDDRVIAGKEVWQRRSVWSLKSSVHHCAQHIGFRQDACQSVILNHL
jgi:coproporphyrinogen III oxidase-like Fe-S oxidoreductase